MWLSNLTCNNLASIKLSLVLCNVVLLTETVPLLQLQITYHIMYVVCLCDMLVIYLFCLTKKHFHMLAHRREVLANQ